MDELALLNDLTGDAPLPGPNRLAPARARLFAEMAAEMPAERTPAATRTHRRFRPARRLLWSTAATGVAAAVAVTMLMTAQQHGRTREPGSPRIVNADAAQVLDAAAAAGDHAHPRPPPPNQTPEPTQHPRS
jgi:dihydrodipicolinate synthase/N-acetylneuraminate lyase